MKTCSCGCGLTVNDNRIFRSGHHSRVNHPLKGKHRTSEVKEKLKLANMGKHIPGEIRRKISLKTSGNKNGSWKGGIVVDKDGYVCVYSPNHPFKDSRNKVFQHRLVMEEHLGRYLKRGEIVHHKNGVKNDNRVENLELISSQSVHAKLHNKERVRDKKGQLISRAGIVYL